MDEGRYELELLLCVTLDEAARRCSVSERSIRDAITCHELVATRLGKNAGAVRVYLPDLVKWVESKRVQHGVNVEVREAVADSGCLPGRSAPFNLAG